VGPKPKHEAKDLKGGNDIYVQNKPPASFSLKNVMRHEAAKNTRAAKNDPFCDLVKKQWPEAACDEKMSQQNVRLFYKDNCGKKSTSMLPGFDCQKLRKEIKKIYPGVDEEPKRVATALHDQPRFAMCTHEAMELLIPFYGERGASDMLKDLITDVEWTENDEICSGKSNKTVHSPRRFRERRCITPFCESAGPSVDCSDMEDNFEQYFKFVGFEVDWTTSDDECGPSQKRNHNQTESKVGAAALTERKVVHKLCINKAYRKLGDLWGGKDEVYYYMDTLFDDTHWTSDDEVCKNNNSPKFQLPKGHQEKRCVSQYCHPSIVDANCSDVEDIMEDLSKDAGHKVDWTSDDGECPHYVRRKDNQTLV
jgi:hypothetical protein